MSAADDAAAEGRVDPSPEKVREWAAALRARAQREAYQIVEQAQALGLEHQARAREQAVRELEGLAEQLSSLRQQLHLQELELERREHATSAAERRILLAEQALADQTSHLRARAARLEAREAELRALGAPGPDAQRLQAENEALTARVLMLEQRLAQRPAETEVDALRARAAEAESWKARAEQARQLSARRDEIARSVAALELELEQARDEATTLRRVVDLLRRERDALRELLSSDVGGQDTFPGLEQAPAAAPPPATSAADLARVVRRARQYMSSPPPSPDGAPLGPRHYDDASLRALIAGMSASRLLLLQGVSGTGKTSLPDYFSRAIGGGSARIEVQSSWRDRLDLLGVWNTFHRRFQASAFTRALHLAGSPRWRDRPFFVVLDELNLSRVEYYFADVLSELESPGPPWRLELPGAEAHVGPLPPGLVRGQGAVWLPVPSNVWFVGTANTDASTFEITPRVYDRAQVLELPRPAAAGVSPPGAALDLGAAALLGAFEQAHAGISAQERLEWTACYDAITASLEKHLGMGSGARQRDQLLRFVAVWRAAGGSIGGALDHFACHKLLWVVKGRLEVDLARRLDLLRADVERALRAAGAEPQLSLARLDHERARAGGG